MPAASPSPGLLLPEEGDSSPPRKSPAHPSLLRDIAIGAAAGSVAALLRLSLPLAPVQLPTITVVIAIAVVAPFVGLAAGLAAALTGGLLAWYLFLDPWTLTLASTETIPMLGFAVIAAVLVTTSHLYRNAQRHRQDAELARLREQAELASLFAREMAHRLKNALSIVQSVAFQSLDGDSEAAARFTARLAVVADAHDLLSEQVDEPSADVCDVIYATLASFEAFPRIHIDCEDTRIGARQVISLALSLHELASNAAEHGALSVPGGSVSLRVEEEAETVRVSWSEQGGPPLADPGPDGFGMKLLRRHGVDPVVAFEPGGFRCAWGLRKP